MEACVGACGDGAADRREGQIVVGLGRSVGSWPLTLQLLGATEGLHQGCGNI